MKDPKKSLVSKINNAIDMKIKIMILETKLAKLEIASDVLGISCINIDKNFD